jgi:hypothetical protein
VALPRGPIHADLFRDNVMFEDGKLTGLFDFYFAGCDTFLFDLAVCLNDWCVRHSADNDDGAHDPARAQALLAAYQSVRPLTARIPELREEFWGNVNVTGENGELNQALEHAGRVADYMEFAELLCTDALQRDESCGGHFRVEHQTEDGEARRDDANFSHVAAWEYQGDDRPPLLHKEPLEYESVAMSTRSYK